MTLLHVSLLEQTQSSDSYIFHLEFAFECFVYFLFIFLRAPTYKRAVNKSSTALKYFQQRPSLIVLISLPS
jgi:hypothetical protein